VSLNSVSARALGLWQYSLRYCKVLVSVSDVDQSFEVKTGMWQERQKQTSEWGLQAWRHSWQQFRWVTSDINWLHTAVVRPLYRVQVQSTRQNRSNVQ